MTKAKDPALVALIGEFMLDWLPRVRRRDEDTVTSYRYSINLFLDYLAAERGVTLPTLTAADLNHENVVGFMGWLASERTNCAPTINHRLSDVRGLIRFLNKRGSVDDVAWERVREVSEVPDERATEFTWLTPKEVVAVVDATAPNREAERDRLLLSLLYESGGRIGEVLALTVADLRPTEGGEVDVHFYGKGNKHRVTPLSADVWSLYQAYAETHLKGCATGDLVFYVTRRDGRHMMSHDNVGRILKGCEERVKAGPFPDLQHLHSHLFRRSRAMHLYQGGMPLETVSEWLGHSNIETTRFYTKVTELMKRDALEKLSEGEGAVFKGDVAFKYAGDDEALRRLQGLR